MKIAIQTMGILTPRPILSDVLDDCGVGVGNEDGELVLAAPARAVGDGL